MKKSICLGIQSLSMEAIRALIDCIIACKLDIICMIYLIKGSFDYTIV